MVVLVDKGVVVVVVLEAVLFWKKRFDDSAFERRRRQSRFRRPKVVQLKRKRHDDHGRVSKPISLLIQAAGVYKSVSGGGRWCR